MGQTEVKLCHRMRKLFLLEISVPNHIARVSLVQVWNDADLLPFVSKGEQALGLTLSLATRSFLFSLHLRFRVFVLHL